MEFLKDRTFNAVLQLVLRRTGGPVGGWVVRAARREGAFGLAPGRLWMAVGALG